MDHDFPRRLEVMKDIYRIKSLATMDADGQVELIAADRLTPRFARGSVLTLNSLKHASRGMAVYKSDTSRRRWYLRHKTLVNAIEKEILSIIEQ